MARPEERGFLDIIPGWDAIETLWDDPETLWEGGETGTGGGAGKPAARIGDAISHGGVIVAGSPNVFIEGPASARVGDAVICSTHGAQVIVSGSTTVFVNGPQKARMGDLISCGAIIVAGAPRTLVGG
jgi:uncharacterized Zn-binding protein involved in type VI secretion